ncbi:TonB family protein [Lysobacter silvisoli]|uniref:TonB family protein n=1 Tax=Lysobacter silvisoli TaxID=2293254 RepID=A0A371K4B7_9GAMM|nr:TonB family protein [Lysobacter silvisoli]RDZ28704.1 TonB family protein [Lysobacter silvisoli]
MQLRSTRRVRPALALALTLLSLGAYAQDPPAPPPPPPPPDWDGSPPPAPRVVDPNLLQRDPSIKRPMRVRYPQAEACMGISGTVVLVLTVGEQGQVQQVQIERSSRNRTLDRAAMNSAREMEFSPEIFNGKPVVSRSRLPVEFALPDAPLQSCKYVRLALVDAQGADQPTPAAGQPLRAKIGLYVPARLELRAGLRRDVAQSNGGVLPIVHEEILNLERPERAELSSIDFVTPQPLTAGSYVLEIRVDGELRNTQRIKVR